MIYTFSKLPIILKLHNTSELNDRVHVVDIKLIQATKRYSFQELVETNVKY